MKKIFYSFIVLITVSIQSMHAQDLLDLLGDSVQYEKIYVTNAFKSSRVINGHSVEMVAGGVLDFRILHRFGQIGDGSYNLYGFDQATIRLGLDYGVSDRLTAGFGRSSSKKEVDGFLKYKALRQSEGKGSFPFSLVLVSGITANGLKYENPEQVNYFSSRLGYYYQALIGRKFSERFSLQLSPTLVHRNIVTLSADPNDVYAIGVGSRFKLSKRIALTQDFFYAVNRSVSEDFQNCLSLGIDIETGGHVFQLHFTNALGMNERAFITETTGKWSNGDIRFGFNISRVFTIADKRKKD